MKSSPSASLRPVIWTCIIAVSLALGYFVWLQGQWRADHAKAARFAPFRAQTNSLAGQNRWDEVLTLAKTQKKQHPDDPNAYWMAGKANFHRGAYKAAISDWNTAVRLEPRWAAEAQPWIETAQGGLVVQGLKLPAPVLTISEEEIERRSLRNSARSLLEKLDYNALEKRASQLRTSGAVFSDGRSKLRTFYDGLAYLPNEKLLPRPIVQPTPQDAQDYFDQRNKRIAQLEAWSQARPASITAQTALGYACLVSAWKTRISNSASNLNRDQAAVLWQRLAQARQVLERSRKLSTQCPVWFTTMQQVALLEGWSREQYDELCATAIKHFPNHQEIYFQRLKYLMPRWKGKSGEWEAEAAKFADDHARRTGSPTEGDILYGRAVWFLREVQPQIFKETSASWPRARSGWQAQQKRQPHSLEIASTMLFLAVEGEDYGIARDLYRNSIKNRFEPRIWQSREYFNQHRSWVFSPKFDSKKA